MGPRYLLVLGKLDAERRRSLGTLASAAKLELANVETTIAALAWLERHDPAAVTFDTAISKAEKICEKVRSKKQLASVPIIALTTDVSDAYIEKLYTLGADDVISLAARAALMSRLRSLPESTPDSVGPRGKAVVADRDRNRSDVFGRVLANAGLRRQVRARRRRPQVLRAAERREGRGRECRARSSASSGGAGPEGGLRGGVDRHGPAPRAGGAARSGRWARARHRDGRLHAGGKRVVCLQRNAERSEQGGAFQPARSVRNRRTVSRRGRGRRRARLYVQRQRRRALHPDTGGSGSRKRSGSSFTHPGRRSEFGCSVASPGAALSAPRRRPRCRPALACRLSTAWAATSKPGATAISRCWTGPVTARRSWTCRQPAPRRRWCRWHRRWACASRKPASPGGRHHRGRASAERVRLGGDGDPRRRLGEHPAAGGRDGAGAGTRTTATAGAGAAGRCRAAHRGAEAGAAGRCRAAHREPKPEPPVVAEPATVEAGADPAVAGPRDPVGDAAVGRSRSGNRGVRAHAPAQAGSSPPPATAASTAPTSQPPDRGRAQREADAAASGEPSAAPSAEPSAAPSAEPSAATGTTGTTAHQLNWSQGYLVVKSSADADVYATGFKIGATNAKNLSSCGMKYVRLGKGDPPSWLSAGQTVDVKCRSVTEVTIEPSK